MNSNSFFKVKYFLVLLGFLQSAFQNGIVAQSIKIAPITISYPSLGKVNLSVCAPYSEYSIEGMNTPDGMGFTYDYYDASLNQFKVLLSKILSEQEPFVCGATADNSKKYKLECRLESLSEGKVVTAFSKISLEITMTWKLTRIEDGEVLFRTKSVGMHKNKIGNA
ncbi:MAG: hypothetical protein IPH93_03065 [Saprospiraceae bacterium]|nr:hypothetical protein [Saprospiraceae bacterium]